MTVRCSSAEILRFLSQNSKKRFVCIFMTSSCVKLSTISCLIGGQPVTVAQILG